MKILICLAWLACVFACQAGTDWRTSFVPRDPWRAIEGQTNYVKLDGVQFCGKIVNVTSNGICIEGEWGALGVVYYPVNGWPPYTPNPPQYQDYFVRNYPYKATIGEIISSADRLMAWYAGAGTYKTANGGSQLIQELDYGIPCGPNPVLLAAAQKQIQQADEKRRKADLRRIQFLERDATNGDSSAQYSLGIHYLHGIGCETNEVLGIFWLMKSAEKGNAFASNDLQEIETESTNGAGVHR